MTIKREELIKRNLNFTQLPMPDLESMTDEQLEKRVIMFESVFEELWDDEDEGNRR